jgi:hypothetical protein
MPRKLTDEDFAERWVPEPMFAMTEESCWTWARSIRADGYGRLGSTLAHKRMYERKYGSVPVGLELDHLCRFKRCVNPDHLEPVTHAENIRRGDTGLHHRLKKHCPSGHPYDEENTRFTTGGYRYCQTCKLQKSAEAYQRKKNRGNIFP